jgi:hypothetical protein
VILLLQKNVTMTMDIFEAKALRRALTYGSRSGLEAMGMSDLEIRAVYDIQRALMEHLDSPQAEVHPKFNSEDKK